MCVATTATPAARFYGKAYFTDNVNEGETGGGVWNRAVYDSDQAGDLV